ncbi:MAG TPA: lysophospholipid acyltransferase family protein [Methylovirgula sp.]|jgi:1-acyl-sn-glycerol-3-phosphate acyltransferase|nr:lysophospholipid acyltransferase family protein [Methylovirgula sp.]
MILLRSLVFNVCFYILLSVLMVLGVPVLLSRRRRSVQSWARLWAQSSLVLLRYTCNLKVEFRGLEHMPAGASMIASKHQSFLETFALLCVVPDFTFVHKSELGRLPFFGWYLKGTGQISIDRARRTAALNEVAKASRRIFAEGRQLIIFPEGTRQPVGAPPEYKASAAFVQAETGVVCVPVALNSGLFWPRRQFRRYPGTIVIEFLEPIAPGLRKSEFMKLLQERIETATNRLVADACAANPELACGKLAGPKPSMEL